MLEILFAVILAPIALISAIVFVCIVIGAVKAFAKAFKRSMGNKE